MPFMTLGLCDTFSVIFYTRNFYVIFDYLFEIPRPGFESIELSCTYFLLGSWLIWSLTVVMICTRRLLYNSLWISSISCDKLTETVLHFYGEIIGFVVGSYSKFRLK